MRGSDLDVLCFFDGARPPWASGVDESDWRATLLSLLRSPNQGDWDRALALKMANIPASLFRYRPGDRDWLQEGSRRPSRPSKTLAMSSSTMDREAAGTFSSDSRSEAASSRSVTWSAARGSASSAHGAHQPGSEPCDALALVRGTQREREQDLENQLPPSETVGRRKADVVTPGHALRRLGS